MKLQHVKYVGSNCYFDWNLLDVRLTSVRLFLKGLGHFGEGVHKWVALVREEDVVVVSGFNERSVRLNCGNWLLRVCENAYRDADQNDEDQAM